MMFPSESTIQLLLLPLSHFSCVRLLATPWTEAYQAPLSMGFSRQEYWNGVPLPSPPGLHIPHQSKLCTQPSTPDLKCFMGPPSNLTLPRNAQMQDNFPDSGSPYFCDCLKIPTHPCMCMLSRFSHVRLFMTPWTAAHQVPPSMGFSRQDYWNGLPLPSLSSIARSS